MSRFQSRFIISVNFCLLTSLYLTLQPSRADASTATYISTVLPWVQQAHSQYGVPISVAIAQSAYESGWILPKPANNFFNITYTGPGCDPYTSVVSLK